MTPGGALALTTCGGNDVTLTDTCCTKVAGATLTPADIELDRLYDVKTARASFTNACEAACALRAPAGPASGRALSRVAG